MHLKVCREEKLYCFIGSNFLFLKIFYLQTNRSCITGRIVFETTMVVLKKIY